jgi:hypothetical protein
MGITDPIQRYSTQRDHSIELIYVEHMFRACSSPAPRRRLGLNGHHGLVVIEKYLCARSGGPDGLDRLLDSHI